MPAAATPASRGSTCRVVFGATATALEPSPAGDTLAVALPLLAGLGHEELLATPGEAAPRAGCTVVETAHETAGLLVAPANAPLEPATRELYRQLLTATRGLRLYRIWNYVPRINAVEHGLENYRSFCRGRSLAFEDRFGAGYQRQLPAASAVGTPGGALAVAFLAGEAEPRHCENPQQIPAFEYPTIYGPRAPSFSRATAVEGVEQRRIFVSGTAAIRGHATIAAGDLVRQLACTRDNLDLIGRAAGAGPQLGATAGWQRSFKVYVRHATDFAAVQSDLDRHLLRPADTVSYLHADLCRADLLVEIEAVLTH